MKTYSVYGIGNALLDTEIQVQDDELAALGVEKGLMTLVDDARRQELLDGLQGHLIKANHASGGSAGNSMIATALFGSPTFLSCKVADDADGDRYLADLEAAGVDHPPRNGRGGGSTGKCLVLITPDAERSMNTSLGVSADLSDAQLDPEALARSEFLYIEGYLVTSPTGRAAAIRARELAREAGVRIAISFSDPGIVAHFRDGLAEMTGERADLVFCNEEEALNWTGSESLEVAIEQLKNSAERFVITRGGRGSLCFDGESLLDIPVHRVQAVDSNGAGDMFAGAFLYALGRGEAFDTAGRFASLAAGRVVAQFGPRLPAHEYPALRREFFGD
jgi:sugar/nucleoside kinase (ribokinase family)